MLSTRRTHFLLRERPFPAGVGVDQDQRPYELGVVAVELQHDGAPGEPAMWERAKPLDQRRKAVRVVRQAEVRGHVRGATGPRLVPGNDGVLVREGGRLWLPHAAVHGRTVNEHQRPPFAQTLIGDLEPVRPNDLHRHNVHPSETDNFKPLREPRARSGAPSGALARRLSRRGGGHSGSTPARGQSGSPRIQQAPRELRASRVRASTTHIADRGQPAP